MHDKKLPNLMRMGWGTGSSPTNVPCCRKRRISDSSVRPLGGGVVLGRNGVMILEQNVCQVKEECMAYQLACIILQWKNNKKKTSMEK